MPKPIPKAHEIESTRSMLPSFTVLILLLTLASIVLLGVIGDSDRDKNVQAKERPAPAANSGADSDSGDDGEAGS